MAPNTEPTVVAMSAPVREKVPRLAEKPANGRMITRDGRGEVVQRYRQRGPEEPQPVHVVKTIPPVSLESGTLDASVANWTRKVTARAYRVLPCKLVLAVAPVLDLTDVVSRGLRGIDIRVSTLSGGFDVGVHLVHPLDVLARMTTNILRLAVSLLGFLLNSFGFNLRLLGLDPLPGGLRLARPAVQRSFTALSGRTGRESRLRCCVIGYLGPGTAGTF